MSETATEVPVRKRIYQFENRTYDTIPLQYTEEDVRNTLRATCPRIAGASVRKVRSDDVEIVIFEEQEKTKG